MNANTNNRTATIHQFPTARVRAAAARLRDEPKRFEELSLQPACEDFSGSWYHEAAIQEADPARPH